MENTILQFEHVTGKNRKFHLTDVSFSLPAGYLMGIAGKNGAGKTTLIDYIMNPKIQYNGTIRLCGEDIRNNHARSLGMIGFVSERNQFFCECSAEKNAQLLGGFYPNFDMEMFQTAMRKMEVRTGKIVGKMSRGEWMRFQMAFAMSHGTKLYLLDEATAGMDPVFRVDFFHILHEIIKDEQASVLMATHLVEELEHKIDYIGIMENGQMSSFGESMPL